MKRLLPNAIFRVFWEGDFGLLRQIFKNHLHLPHKPLTIIPTPEREAVYRIDSGIFMTAAGDGVCQGAKKGNNKRFRAGKLVIPKGLAIRKSNLSVLYVILFDV